MTKEIISKIFIDKTGNVIKKINGISNDKIIEIKLNGDVLSNDDKLKKLHEQFPTKSKMLSKYYLYVISFAETVPFHIISTARQKFIEERSNKSANFSRNNEEHTDTCNVYVGTSMDIKSRFRTHLGLGSGTTTWALYLKKWVEEGDIIIKVIPLVDFLEDESQLIEDIIWNSLKPMFGKKGGK